jgi:cytochrome c biogenesis protein CcmG/thiol:disulfide interchange protein DsbE
VSRAEEPGRPRRRVALFGAGGVAVLAVVLVVVLATRPPAVDTQANSPLVGRAAPPIAGASLDGGGPVDLAAWRGRFVVVNFFASWCPPCRTEAPELVQFTYEHKAAADASVLGVVFEDTASAGAAFARSTGATWPVVADPAGQVALDYGVRAPPESFLVAPDGRVVARIVGGVTVSGLDQLLARARAEGA